MPIGVFQGSVEFDLRLALFGKSVTRRARIIYDFTPLWPYFDTRNGTELRGQPNFEFNIEILALPRAEAPPGHPRNDPTMKPTWVRADALMELGVLNRPIMASMYDKVDADVRRRDAQNRVPTSIDNSNSNLL